LYIGILRNKCFIVLSQLEQENQQLKERIRSLEKVELEIEKTREQNAVYKQRIRNLEQQLAEANHAQREAENRLSQKTSLPSVVSSYCTSCCKLGKENLATENSRLHSELLEKQAIISSLAKKIRSHDSTALSCSGGKNENAESNGKDMETIMKKLELSDSRSKEMFHFISSSSSIF